MKCQTNTAILSCNLDNSLYMPFQVIETCKGKQIGNTHYKIELIDTNRETDINIAKELVAGGLARPSRELAEVKLLTYAVTLFI